MGLQSEFGTPTKIVSENGKHVPFCFRGRNNNYRHHLNGLKTPENVIDILEIEEGKN